MLLRVVAGGGSAALSVTFQSQINHAVLAPAPTCVNRPKKLKDQRACMFLMAWPRNWIEIPYWALYPRPVRCRTFASLRSQSPYFRFMMVLFLIDERPPLLPDQRDRLTCGLAHCLQMGSLSWSRNGFQTRRAPFVI